MTVLRIVANQLVVHSYHLAMGLFLLLLGMIGAVFYKGHYVFAIIIAIFTIVPVFIILGDQIKKTLYSIFK
jgi:hypothetical protein